MSWKRHTCVEVRVFAAALPLVEKFFCCVEVQSSCNEVNESHEENNSGSSVSGRQQIEVEDDRASGKGKGHAGAEVQEGHPIYMLLLSPYRGAIHIS